MSAFASIGVGILTALAAAVATSLGTLARSLTLDQREIAFSTIARFAQSLQILDDGRLTDGHGRTVDFKNTIVIMTSNIGSEFLLEGVTPGGEIKEDARNLVMGALRAHFRPEFLNRVDEIVVFRPLGREQIRQGVRVVGRSVGHATKRTGLTRQSPRCMYTSWSGRRST